MSSHFQTEDNTSGRKKVHVGQQHVGPYRSSASTPKIVYATPKDVTDAVTPTKTAMVSLDKALEAQRKKVSSLGSKVDSHKQASDHSLATLGTKVDKALHSHKQASDSALASLGNAIKANGDGLSSLSNKVDKALHSHKQASDHSLATLGTKVDSALASLGNAIKANGDGLSSLSTKVDKALHSHKQASDHGLATLGTKVDSALASLGNAIKANGDDLSSLSTKVDSHKQVSDGALAALSNAIKANGDGLSSLSTKVDKTLHSHKQASDHSLAALGTKVDKALHSHKQALDNAILNSGKASDHGLASLGNAVKANNSTLSKLDSKVEAHKKEDSAIIANLQAQIQGLTKQLHTLVGKVSTLEAKSQLDKLHVGGEADIPDQPDSKKESGVWKDAPLSLSVNGGLVLHDVGYTNKKGYNLTLDPDTHRLLVYHGK